MMRNISNEYIGAMCANFRKYELKQSQQQVADICNLSRELVSKFETGKIPNSKVFFYYIKMGIFEWIPIEKWEGWQVG